MSTAPKPTFNQIFGNVTLPIKPSVQVTGATMTIEEFDNVNISGPTMQFSGMLANAGFTPADTDKPVERVVTI